MSESSWSQSVEVPLYCRCFKHIKSGQISEVKKLYIFPMKTLTSSPISGILIGKLLWIHCQWKWELVWVRK